VPILHKELLKQFAVESNLTRILEMQNYAHILKMLVNVVGCVVFAFGLFTVTLLLSDITSRKKGDIGILSCMGIPKWAAVYFVIIRATLIGTLGCLIAYVSSIAISLILSACNVRCAAPIYDLWWLLPFSIICCWAGAVVPAWRAVLLDPVKCLLEGKL
jgi:ABC-type antimicrobial peptide transport system permease subunit